MRSIPKSRRGFHERTLYYSGARRRAAGWVRAASTACPPAVIQFASAAVAHLRLLGKDFFIVEIGSKSCLFGLILCDLTAASLIIYLTS